MSVKSISFFARALVNNLGHAGFGEENHHKCSPKSLLKNEGLSWRLRTASSGDMPAKTPQLQVTFIQHDKAALLTYCIHSLTERASSPDNTHFLPELFLATKGHGIRGAKASSLAKSSSLATDSDIHSREVPDHEQLGAAHHSRAL